MLIHGGMCERGFWSAQVEAFSARYTVVSLDLGGHGESGRNRRVWTVASFGADVAAVVRHLGLADVVLIGHGMGCAVMVEAAARLGGLVRGLIGVDLFDIEGPPMSPTQVDAFLAPMRADFVGTLRTAAGKMLGSHADAGLRSRVVETMAAFPPGIGLEVMGNLLAYPLNERVRAYLPLLALINSADYQPTNSRAAERHGVPVRTVADVGHFAMLERPEMFNRLLQETLDALGRTTPTPKGDAAYRQALRSLLASELLMDEGDIEDEMPFLDMGMDSTSVVTWVRRINSHFGLSISAGKIYTHPTLRDLAEYILQELAGGAGPFPKSAPVAASEEYRPDKALPASVTVTESSVRQDDRADREMDRVACGADAWVLKLLAALEDGLLTPTEVIKLIDR